jgi:hypothetical protein
MLRKAIRTARLLRGVADVGQREMSDEAWSSLLQQLAILDRVITTFHAAKTDADLTRVAACCTVLVPRGTANGSEALATSLDHVLPPR